MRTVRTPSRPSVDSHPVDSASVGFVVAVLLLVVLHVLFG